MSLPSNLSDIITKVRRVTGRPSTAQISDTDIIKYINTFYIYDLPEHLRLESLRYNYQFVTTANIPVYDLPTNTYLTTLPPLYIAGYQSYFTQSRATFYRINPGLNFLQQSVYTGNNTPGPYTGGFLTNTPILPGFKPNPPGAYAANTQNLLPANFINWNVVVSALLAPNATSGISPSITLVDDGLGNLINVLDPGTTPGTGFNICGSVNYITGAINITNFLDQNGGSVSIPNGSAINVQYIPYVASRPEEAAFFQDQIYMYPIPDQAYTVSFEAYKYPVSFTINADGSFNGFLQPQLNEWWQLLAYGASDKIFADNADFENISKFRPLLKEQMDLIQRRTIVQQTSERTASIYTEQTDSLRQYPFGSPFGGF